MSYDLVLGVHGATMKVITDSFIFVLRYQMSQSDQELKLSKV